MITKFYEHYISLFDRFYKAMEKESLIFFLSTDSQYWLDDCISIGPQLFIGLVGDDIVLVRKNLTRSSTLCFPNFVGCPIRLLYRTLSLDSPKMRGYLHAMVSKVLPAFWNDLGIILTNMKPINLDILDVNTPKNTKSITIRDETLLICMDNDDTLMYSINRLPSEYEILQRIKRGFSQEVETAYSRPL